MKSSQDSDEGSDSNSEGEPSGSDVIENGVVYKKSKRPGGRWSSEEHQRFIEALRIYGKDWQQIEEAVKTRTSA